MAGKLLNTDNKNNNNSNSNCTTKMITNDDLIAAGRGCAHFAFPKRTFSVPLCCVVRGLYEKKTFRSQI